MQLKTTLRSLHQQALMQQTSPKEPKICLPGKVNGNGSKFPGFLNQVRLVNHMQPKRYRTDAAQVGLVETLLTATALAWLLILIFILKLVPSFKIILPSLSLSRLSFSLSFPSFLLLIKNFAKCYPRHGVN